MAADLFCDGARIILTVVKPDFQGSITVYGTVIQRLRNRWIEVSVTVPNYDATRWFNGPQTSVVGTLDSNGFRYQIRVPILGVFRNTNDQLHLNLHLKYPEMVDSRPLRRSPRINNPISFNFSVPDQFVMDISENGIGLGCVESCRWDTDQIVYLKLRIPPAEDDNFSSFARVVRTIDLPDGLRYYGLEFVEPTPADALTVREYSEGDPELLGPIELTELRLQ